VNSFGRIFRVTIFGESHGKGIGVVVDGCPPGISLTAYDFTKDLSRRKSGALGTTPRSEDDAPEILSGVYNDITTGAPIMIQFQNRNTVSKDYSQFKDTPRPGHADYTADVKFGGFNDPRGGGHFSGRVTLALVAAGVIAKKVITPIVVLAEIIELAGKKYSFEESISDAVKSGDSIGGIVECRCAGIPVGCGEPFFDSVESLISHIVFSIPAVKGIEFGNGFSAAKLRGSGNNDLIADSKGTTTTNNCGGINGGITNGNDIVFRTAFKPTPSISVVQKTFNFKKNVLDSLSIEGRHDACLVLRTPPVIESAASIVLADLMMINNLINRR